MAVKFTTAAYYLRINGPLSETLSARTCGLYPAQMRNYAQIPSLPSFLKTEDELLLGRCVLYDGKE
jgi:hypothetical protein